MAALRRECVIHYATPRAFGRWVNESRSLPWVVSLAALLLAVAAVIWQGVGAAAAEMSMNGPRMVMPFWTLLPHWLLGSVFTLLLLFDVFVLVRGGRRFWRDMQASAPAAGTSRPLGASLRAALRRIVWHEDFGMCAESRSRRTSHLLVVYGMLALWLVSLWAVTARWNPLLEGLVYPLGFWNPWKLLANVAGLAVAVGAILMLAERAERPATGGATRYADGALLGLLLTIVLTGFASELTHSLRIEPLRFAAYALHLVAVFGLLWMLPYSKLAHAVYRTLALVHSERIGRGRERGQS
jgi:quinone-modifying oxidoreductase subunit QmoC